MNQITELEKRIRERYQHSNATFIFPSEVVAASWRACISGGFGKAIWSDRFISWDKFKEIVFSQEQEKEPVNTIVRTLYVLDLLQKNRDGQHLKRIVPIGASASPGITAFVRRLLPLYKAIELAILPQAHKLDPPLAEDLEYLTEDYQKFLDKNGFFEPSSLDIVPKDITDREYVCIFPEVIEDFDEYENELRRFPGFQTITTEIREKVWFHQYTTAVQEIDSVLTRIEELLDNGVPYQNIAVTCASPESLEYLLQKADLREVPLTNRQGKSALEYPGGKLFSLISSCRPDDMSFANLRDFLLYQGIPWENTAKHKLLLSECVRSHWIGNYRGDDPLLSRLGKITLQDADEQEKLKTAVDYLAGLFKAVRGIHQAPDFTVLKKRLSAFINTYLRFYSAEKISQLVIEYSLYFAGKLAEEAEKLRALKITNPFSVWISLLKDSIYVPRDLLSGIPVYPYKVSAGINVDYHFVVSLTQGAVKAVKKRFPFLHDDQEAALGLEPNNMTDQFLELYALSGKEVTISGSERGFHGTSLVPGYFLKNASVSKVSSENTEAKDLYDAEYPLWAGSAGSIMKKTYKRQAEGFRFFQGRGKLSKEDDFTLSPVEDKKAAEALTADRKFVQEKKISATQLGLYAKCPFSYFLQYYWGLEERDFTPIIQDHPFIGLLQHAAVQRFFRSFQEGPEKRFRKMDLPQYKEKMRTIVSSLFLEFEEQGKNLPRVPWNILEEQCKKDCMEFLELEAATFPDFRHVYEEKGAEAPIAGTEYKYSGRMDRVAEGKSGKIIIDYKKGKISKKQFQYTEKNPAFQAPLYIILGKMENWKIDSVYYYSFKESKYVKIYDLKKDEDELTAVQSMIDDTAAELAEKRDSLDFSLPEDFECNSCDFRAVCREKYVLRER